jgi:hypothetical protein
VNQDAARRPRVVILGHETCGLIHDLDDEFGRRGWEVVTVAMPHRFYSAHYDHSLYDLVRDAARRVLRSNWLADRTVKALWEVCPALYLRLEQALLLRLVRGADLYVQVWAHIPHQETVLAALYARRIPIAVLMMGSDVRDYNVFARQYDVTRWTFPDEYHAVPLREKLRLLRLHECYATAHFSVPDQMGLALRPYHHLQVPFELSRFTFRVPAREVPVVLHAPSVPHVKGTDVIEGVIETLRTEGVPFEFVSVRNLPHDKVLRLLTEADVLVDELVLHGPGWLGFEAMASGCAVATRYLEDSPACFRPPVWAIDEHTITDRLRILLTDRDLRVRLAHEGRAYVEAHNRIEHVVDTLLAKVEAGPDGPHDYVPDYLTTAYVPRSDEEAETLNAANALVAGEAWYRAHVAGHAHDGLVF